MLERHKFSVCGYSVDCIRKSLFSADTIYIGIINTHTKQFARYDNDIHDAMDFFTIKKNTQHTFDGKKKIINLCMIINLTPY